MKRFLKWAFVYCCLAFFFPTLLFAWPVPDTGQTKCYDDTGEISCPQPGEPFYGQDAQYQGIVHSYTKLGLYGIALPDSATSTDGWIMTRDNITGLVWEVKTEDNKGAQYRLDSAESYVTELNSSQFGGFSDWRLPSVQELNSIIEMTGRPSVNLLYFPKTGSSNYWTTTAYVPNSLDVAAWNVDFGYGFTDVSNSSSYSHCVRAVRGGQSKLPNNFNDNGDGTITDNNTYLMWQKMTAPGSIPAKYTWQEALAYAENLSLGGYYDWRLPNRNELQTLVDYSMRGPSIDGAFESNTLEDEDYWSSTTHLGYGSAAISGRFASGQINYTRKSRPSYVRVVRGGSIGDSSIIKIVNPDNESSLPISYESPINWETAGIGGNVNISISRDGGRTYTDIVSSTPNDGNYDWVVTSPASNNCTLRVVPEFATYKWAISEKFSIKDVILGVVDNSGVVDISDAILSLQIEAGYSLPQKVYKTADVEGNGKIGLEEAINALQVVSGTRQ